MESAKKVDLKRSKEEPQSVQFEKKDDLDPKKDKSLSREGFSNSDCPEDSRWSEAMDEYVQI